MNRQYSFDHQDADPSVAAGGEDEFMQYYRKFRPSPTSSQSLSQASSSSQSFSLFGDLNRTSSGGSVKSSEGGGGSSSASSKRRKWFLPKKRIKIPKSRSMEEAPSIRLPSRHLLPEHHTRSSPLGGLPGVLSERKTFSSSNSTTTSLGHQSGSGMELDSQSRDSGHSSGAGSPDLRGLRKRRSRLHHHHHHQQSPPLRNYGRDWYMQRQSQFAAAAAAAAAGGYPQVKN